MCLSRQVFVVLVYRFEPRRAVVEAVVNIFIHVLLSTSESFWAPFPPLPFPSLSHVQRTLLTSIAYFNGLLSAQTFWSCTLPRSFLHRIRELLFDRPSASALTPCFSQPHATQLPSLRLTLLACFLAHCCPCYLSHSLTHFTQLTLTLTLSNCWVSGLYSPALIPCLRCCTGLVTGLDISYHSPLELFGRASP